jgi:hypothetical protein
MCRELMPLLILIKGSSQGHKQPASLRRVAEHQWAAGVTCVEIRKMCERLLQNATRLFAFGSRATRRGRGSDWAALRVLMLRTPKARYCSAAASAVLSRRRISIRLCPNLHHALPQPAQSTRIAVMQATQSYASLPKRYASLSLYILLLISRIAIQ